MRAAAALVSRSPLQACPRSNNLKTRKSRGSCVIPRDFYMVIIFNLDFFPLSPAFSLFACINFAAYFVRTNLRSSLAFVHLKQFFCLGKLLVIVRRSLRRKRLDFLLLASLDCKKLRVLRALRMTDRSFVFVLIICKSISKYPPRSS